LDALSEALTLRAFQAGLTPPLCAHWQEEAIGAEGIIDIIGYG